MKLRRKLKIINMQMGQEKKKNKREFKKTKQKPTEEQVKDMVND